MDKLGEMILVSLSRYFCHFSKWAVKVRQVTAESHMSQHTLILVYIQEFRLVIQPGMTQFKAYWGLDVNTLNPC